MELPPIISFDVSILGAYFTAQSSLRAGTSLSVPNTASRGPAVETPWDLDDDDRLLASRINGVRDQTKFINENTLEVRRAASDEDNRALFTLYRALTDLKTIADYAAQDSTPEALLAKFSTQFQGGLKEVQEYIQGVELDKLTLLFGKKEPRVTSQVTLGKNNRDIQGAILSVSSKTEAIPGINGDEVFNIHIEAGSTKIDDISIDLSQISGDVTLESVRNLINAQIGALTILNGDGEEVRKYGTRFDIAKYGDDNFSLFIDIDSIEQVTFTAAASDPALFIAGNHQDLDSDAVSVGSLSKYRNLDGSGPLKSFYQEIAGVDENSFLPPEDFEANKDAVSPAAQAFLDKIARINEALSFSSDDEEEEGVSGDRDIETGIAKEQKTTQTGGVAVDSQGNVYVVGTSAGDFGNQRNGAETSDVFLSKYDASGNLLFSRLLGANDEAQVFDIAIDADDNVVIAGQVNGELHPDDLFTGFDSFVTKYDSVGTELWTQQLDSLSTDQASALAIDAAGDIYITGQVGGRLNATTTHQGGVDGFVVKLGGEDGTLVSSAQFGGAGNEYGEEIAIASDGNILVASREGGNVILRKLDVTDLSNVLATHNLGDLGGGKISGLQVDGSQIFISGTSQNGNLSGGGTVVAAHQGNKDGFITRLDDGGGSFSAQWTHFIGSDKTDEIEGLTVANGSLYVAGRTTGTLPGQSQYGSSSGFAARIDVNTGVADWVHQLGGVGGLNGSSSLAFSQNGSSVLTRLGLPTGEVDHIEDHRIVTQTSARAGDHFYISVNGGAQKKIVIEDRDTFETLAIKIGRASFRFVKAIANTGLDGPELRIESKNNGTIDIFAGKGATDALARLGLEPTKILPSDLVLGLSNADGEEATKALGTDPDNLGGVFGFDLVKGFALRTKTEAAYVASQLEAALETIQRAHRSLTFDPIKAALLVQSKQGAAGPAPAYLSKQLSNYQAGLDRLLGGASQSSILL